MSNLITDFFVYGTLKRGECRDKMWPRKSLSIREVFVRATLYDIGPYPAIRVEEGDAPDESEALDWVKGELWSFDRVEVPATLLVLDEIEGTNQKGSSNLYDHILVRVFDQMNSRASGVALAYQYSSLHGLRYSRLMRPGEGESFVSWSATVDRS